MMNPLKDNFMHNRFMQPNNNIFNENMLLNMLKQQNPQGYQTFMNLKNSGQNPNVILQQMMSNINPQQKSQIEQFAKMFNIR